MSYNLIDTVDTEISQQDNGLAVFKGQKSAYEINDWLIKFQEAVNSKTGNDLLQFTSEVWLPNQSQSPIGKTSIVSENHLPFLDMELYRGECGSLSFRVHIKPNQQIKYLNSGSSHMPDCFKAIRNGVCYRLTKLTTSTETNKDKPLDKLYLDHFQALELAKLSTNFPTPTLK